MIGQRLWSACSYAKIFLKIALSDRALITALIAGGRTDLFDCVTRLKENQLLQGIGLTLAEPERRYCTAMLNAMLLSVVKVWAENGGRESAEELYEMLRAEIALIWDYL